MPRKANAVVNKRQACTRLKTAAGRLNKQIYAHKLMFGLAVVVILMLGFMLLIHRTKSSITTYWLPDRATRRAVDVEASDYAIRLALIDKTDKPVKASSSEATVFSSSAKNDEAVTLFEAPATAYHASRCPNVLGIDETPGPYQTGHPECKKIGSAESNDVFRIIYTGGGPADQAVYTTRGDVFIAFVIPANDVDTDVGPILDFIKMLKPINSTDLPNWLTKNAQTMAEQNKQVDDYQAGVPLAYTKLGFTVYKPSTLPSDWQSYLSETGANYHALIYGGSPDLPQSYILQYETILSGKKDVSHADATANLSVIEYKKEHFSYANGMCGLVPKRLYLPSNAGAGEMVGCTQKNGSFMSNPPTRDMPYRVFHSIGDTTVMLELSTTSTGGNEDLSAEIINSLTQIIDQLQPVDGSSLRGNYEFQRVRVF